MIKGLDYPEWLNMQGLSTMQQQHLLPEETPKEAYLRVTKSLGHYYKQELIEHYNAEKAKNKNTHFQSISEINDFVKKLQERWFSYIWKGWLCLSTPVIANCGTTRGLPISCNIMDIDDSIDSIYGKIHELGKLTQNGAGIGVCFDNIRGSGMPISSGGTSEGPARYIKMYDSAIASLNQNGRRRGYMVASLAAKHKDAAQFINLRDTKGDHRFVCRDLQLSIAFDDEDMNAIKNGDKKMRGLWADTISMRFKTGSPYIHFRGNAEAGMPECFKQRGFKIKSTNLCSEIQLPHDSQHTVVCCLSSINMFYYDLWKDNDLFIVDCLMLLDANIAEYIAKGQHIKGLEAAVRFARKTRALGLGLLGLQSYFQEKMIPYASLEAISFCKIFGKRFTKGKIDYEKVATKMLPIPEWCDDTRNATHFTLPPTTTSSIIGGAHSQSLEALMGNVMTQSVKSGVFYKANIAFENLIKNKYPKYDNEQFYKTVGQDLQGSVQKLDFLTKDEKQVFLTAYEINQLDSVRQAAEIQKFIDQGISMNLFFPYIDKEKEPEKFKFVNKVHLEAHDLGLKALYYLHGLKESSSFIASTFNNCTSCEG